MAVGVTRPLHAKKLQFVLGRQWLRDRHSHVRRDFFLSYMCARAEVGECLSAVQGCYRNAGLKGIQSRSYCTVAFYPLFDYECAACGMNFARSHCYVAGDITVYYAPFCSAPAAFEICKCEIKNCGRHELLVDGFRELQPVATFYNFAACLLFS